jgi:hypothetical protein
LSGQFVVDETAHGFEILENPIVVVLVADLHDPTRDGQLDIQQLSPIQPDQILDAHQPTVQHVTHVFQKGQNIQE